MSEIHIKSIYFNQLLFLEKQEKGKILIPTLCYLCWTTWKHLFLLLDKAIIFFVNIFGKRRLEKFWKKKNLSSAKMHCPKNIHDGITAVVTGNDTFWQESIPQNSKTIITQPKHDILMKQKGFESLWFGFGISAKTIVFCFGHCPWGPYFCTSWAKKR